MAQASRAAKNLIYKKMDKPKLVHATKVTVKKKGKK